ncbi:MAG: hypothetical protein EA362_12125 [Saprospirales bacterium]|nr:MAG: hypothetical protein EA362_12125 [Saprospirales bacterium]
MSNFKAKYINKDRFYELRKFNFLVQIPPGISIGFIVGGMFGETNWTLIAIGGIIYIIAAYYSYTRLQEFKKLYESFPKLRLNETELLLDSDGKKEKRVGIKSGERIHLQVRTTSIRERVFDYFKKDYAELSANFIIVKGNRYDFVLDSDFALRKLLKLLPIWEEKGILVSWDFEKAFGKEMKRLGLKTKKSTDQTRQ